MSWKNSWKNCWGSLRKGTGPKRFRCSPRSGSLAEMRMVKAGWPATLALVDEQRQVRLVGAGGRHVVLPQFRKVVHRFASSDHGRRQGHDAQGLHALVGRDQDLAQTERRGLEFEAQAQRLGLVGDHQLALARPFQDEAMSGARRQCPRPCRRAQQRPCPHRPRRPRF